MAMSEPDPDLRQTLARHGQEHLLKFWDQLDVSGRAGLVEELRSLDCARLERLVSELVLADEASAVDPARVEPIEVERLPRTDAERAARRHAAERGAEALAAGEVAVVVVAGGQGTRLGFEGPKGTYPIGPVSASSLFQIHAEKVLAMGRRYGRPIPFYIMTSPENHGATKAFFNENGGFGLEHVRFFVQGQMPAVDRRTGKVLLAAPDRLALSPDGHGGTLAALAARESDGGPSCLDEMRDRGIRTIFYFQVDNPLVKIADPAFLGLHRDAGAEMSFKVVEKLTPEDKMGVVVRVDGVPQVIEYSDLSPSLAEQREADGSLRFWAGSIAVHLLEREFVERMTADGGQLPFHRAFKKVSYVDESGNLVRPDGPNAVKFETFIFDALPRARNATIVETDRAREFEPLKNATGPDSPATVRQKMSDQFGDWLEAAGVPVPRRPDGSVPFGLEISPLYALDSGELKAKLAPGLTVDGPRYWR